MKDALAKGFGAFDIDEARRLAKVATAARNTEECMRLAIVLALRTTTSATGEYTHVLSNKTDEFVGCLTAELEAKGFKVRSGGFGAFNMAEARLLAEEHNATLVTTECARIAAILVEQVKTCASCKYTCHLAMHVNCVCIGHIKAELVARGFQVADTVGYDFPTNSQTLEITW